jgi:hypothetical protein
LKIFNEASSVFNKFFPSVPTKKRSRPEGFSNDRSGDRLALGPGMGKMGIQGQTLPGCFELDQQKLDERPKSGALNKRTRTSMVSPDFCLTTHALGRFILKLNRPFVS